MSACHQFHERPDRRTWLRQTGCGFGGVSLAALAHQLQASEQNSIPGAHFAAQAKRIIFLFMHGGPSQIDTFDYKPQLEKDDDKPVPFAKPRVVSGA
ncbi:MAG: DUF1501 domain-containing protein, partial [Planctomycetaceae bacterium]